MKFITDTGKTITANSMAAAVEIAKQYNMGSVVTMTTVDKKTTVAKRRIGIWSDLTQSWELVPTMDYALAAQHWEMETYDDSCIVVAFANGSIKNLTKAERDEFNHFCEIVV